MVVSDDRRQAIVGFYQVLNRPAPGVDRLPLRGLDPGLDYRVSVWPASDDAVSRANALTRRGDDLHANGLLCRRGSWLRSRRHGATSGRACSCSRRV